MKKLSIKTNKIFSQNVKIKSIRLSLTGRRLKSKTETGPIVDIESAMAAMTTRVVSIVPINWFKWSEQSEREKERRKKERKKETEEKRRDGKRRRKAETIKAENGRDQLNKE